MVERLVRNEEVRGSTPLGSTIPPTSPPLRLALLASHFADYSLELAVELARDHAVLLLIDGDQLGAECAPQKVVEARSRLNLHVFRQHGRWSRAAGAVSAAARLATFRPHALIAHEHGWTHVTGLQRCGAVLSRTLLIVHDPEPHAGRDAVIAGKKARQIEAQRRNAHTLFAHGRFCAQQLALVAPTRAPIVSIPHGPVLRPREAPPPPRGQGRLLMFGRMEAYKGLDVLLAACRQLADRGACPPLHLLGRGPELDRLAPDFQRLPGVIVDRGYATRPTVLGALAAADGVVLPYLEATQSGVAAAAFANGRPVLASAVGGLLDVVREGVNGRLVAPGDPAVLADALSSFSREAASLRAGACETAHEALAWKHAAAALVAAARS